MWCSTCRIFKTKPVRWDRPLCGQSSRTTIVRRTRHQQSPISSLHIYQETATTNDHMQRSHDKTHFIEEITHQTSRQVSAALLDSYLPSVTSKYAQKARHPFKPRKISTPSRSNTQKKITEISAALLINKEGRVPILVRSTY